MTRQALPRSVRFEVFKRDGFTCQYCGAKAPDTLLHCDHIRPVSRGGQNELLNLVTACRDCNSGKGARMLDDRSAVERQRRQIEEMQERRQQLEMMLEWRDEVASLEADEVEVVSAAIHAKSSCGPAQRGKADIDVVGGIDMSPIATKTFQANFSKADVTTDRLENVSLSFASLTKGPSRRKAPFRSCPSGPNTY